MPGRRALAGGRRDVDDRAAAALAHPGQRSARRANGTHQVELEGRLPVGVGQLAERTDLGAADVVDEAVDAAELRFRGRHDALRLAGTREVGGDVHVARPFAAPARADDDRAFGLQLLRDDEPDPSGRAGDEADLVA